MALPYGIKTLDIIAVLSDWGSFKKCLASFMQKFAMAVEGYMIRSTISWLACNASGWSGCNYAILGRHRVNRGKKKKDNNLTMFANKHANLWEKLHRWIWAFCSHIDLCIGHLHFLRGMNLQLSTIVVRMHFFMFYMRICAYFGVRFLSIGVEFVLGTKITLKRNLTKDREKYMEFQVSRPYLGFCPIPKHLLCKI